MVFLIDKYKINTRYDIKYNKSIYDRYIYNYVKNKYDFNEYLDLINNATSNDELIQLIRRNIYMNNMTDEEYKNRYVQLPNLFIYGASGSGKKTFIRLLLENIYNKTINNTYKVIHQIVGYGNSIEDKEIEQSNYHIIIEPDNSGFDRYVMQEIISEYAQNTPLCINGCNTPFKIVLINNADNLSAYAQKALRCTMEKYHRTCKFILCCNQASKVINALRSRCLQIRMPRPTNNDIFNIIYDISCNENINISNEQINQIVKLSRRNIKTAYSLLHIYISNYDNIYINDDIYTLSWIECLQKVVNYIKMFMETNNIFNVNTMNQMRELLYTIFTTNISGNHIITQFMILMMNTIQFEPILLSKIIQIIGEYEVRITKGKKIIIHLEALIINIFHEIQLYKMQLKN